MDLISNEDYLKIFEEKTTWNRQGRKGFYSVMGKYLKSGVEYNPKKFNDGDIIHTIACHYVEDQYGNDINQDIIYVIPDIITGEYKVVGTDGNDGYYCIKIKDVFGESGQSSYVGNKIIYENFDIKKKKSRS